jgi:hypothetical protein
VGLGSGPTHPGGLSQVDDVLVNRVTYMPSVMSPIILNGKVVDADRTDYSYDMLSYALRPWVSSEPPNSPPVAVLLKLGIVASLRGGG